MTKYFTQFDESTQTIGTNLAGWTVRGGGAPTRAPAYGDPTVIPVKRRYLPFTTDNTGDYRCLSWDAIDADTNRAKANLVSAFTVNLTDVEELHLYARGAGSGTVTDFYRLRVKLAGASNVNFDKMAASAYTGAVASATVTLSAGKSYFVRFLVDGTTVRARLWDAALGMVGEPTTWSIDTTDSSVTAAGWVAIGGRHSTLTGKIAPFNFLAVATNGDSAVAPRTNTEYAAWLASQTALRCVLAELSATGYDSAGAPYTKTVNAYISTHGYTSAQQDTPSGKHYDGIITGIPTFRREMSSALSGAAQTGFGDLVVSNPAGDRQHVQNLLLYACKFNSWFGAATVSTAAATPPPGRARADQLTDSNAAAYEERGTSVTVANDTGTWYFVVDVKKTTGGTAKTVGVDFVLSGGTPVSVSGRLNTDTGATQNPGTRGVQSVTAPGGAEFWRWTLSIDNNASGNTALAVYVYPAVATWPAADSAATTGSAIVSGAWLYRDPHAIYGNSDGTALDFVTQPGARDDWLRMRWNRNYLRLYLGDPSWPKHDFRLIVLGRLGMPTAPNEREIRFPIADLSDALNAPLQSKFTSGDLIGAYKPTVIGRLYGPSCCEPPLTDAATLTHTLASAAIETFFGYNAADLIVSDNGVRIMSSAKTVTAVNIATDTMTSAGHGLLEDSAVVFTAGTPPAPLAFYTEYYVIAAGLTADDFRLAATVGGAAINLTAATTGATFDGFQYVLDKSAATVRLCASPAGRITVGNFDDAVANNTVATMYERVIFTLLGMSANFKDAASFSNLQTQCLADSLVAGLWLDTAQHTAASAMARIAAGSGTWYGITPDGLFQVGIIDWPGGAYAGDVVQSFTESDVTRNSLRLVDVVRSVDFADGVITYQPLFGSLGVVPTADPYFQRGRTVLNYAAPSGSGLPLDDYPNQRDSTSTTNIDTFYQTSAGVTAYIDQQVALFKHALGIFEFQTRLPASQLNIGDTISLTFPRMGWKTYSTSDPASPDNTGTIDATKAVVIGIDTDLNRNRVTVKCFRRIPGYYPTADLN